MTRLTRLFTALSLTGVLAGAVVAIVACARPGAPTEVKPMAPRPEPVGPSAMPVLPDPLTPPDARSSNGPVSVTAMPVPSFQSFEQIVDGGTGTGAPLDAGTPDAYTPPLPAIPDGNIPADSRLEPSRLRD